jgi:hypothetical protein
MTCLVQSVIKVLKSHVFLPFIILTSDASILIFLSLLSSASLFMDSSGSSYFFSDGVKVKAVLLFVNYSLNLNLLFSEKFPLSFTKILDLQREISYGSRVFLSVPMCVIIVSQLIVVTLLNIYTIQVCLVDIVTLYFFLSFASFD